MTKNKNTCKTTFYQKYINYIPSKQKNKKTKKQIKKQRNKDNKTIT